VFFIVPLFLSVALGMSPIETGVRLLPLSLSLLLAAAGIPRFLPGANPRRIVRIGILALIAGIVVLIASLEVGADASIVFVPMLIVGFGIGAMASQLGAALAGSTLIAALTASFLTGIEQNPNVPQQMKDQANVNLAAGAPFMSNADVTAQMEKAGVPADVQDDVLAQNVASQIEGLRAALSILAVLGVVSLFFTGRIPNKQPGSEPAPA